MDLDELLSNRDAINERLLRVVDEAAHPWGIKVTRVEIKDINPPANLVESMARQMMAERNKRAQILEAEGLQAVRRSRRPRAAREAAFRDAEARERSAEAEARATQVVSEAIAKGDVQAINYFVAQKYTEALAKIGIGHQQQDRADADRGLVADRLARRHRRDRQGSLRRREGTAGAQRQAARPPVDPPRRKLTGSGDDRCWNASFGRARPLELDGSGLRAAGAGNLVPGVFLLWIGIAALIVGAVSLALWDAGFWIWEVQVVVFLVLSLVSAFAGKRIMSGRGDETDQPLLNRRGEQLVGRTATLTEPIREGRGRIRLGDTLWRVAGPDLPAGAGPRRVGRRISSSNWCVEPV